MARQLNPSTDSCLSCSVPTDSIKTGFVDDKDDPIVLDDEDVKAKVLKALCNHLMPQNLADIPLQFSEGMFPFCTSCKDLVTGLWECQEVIRRNQVKVKEGSEGIIRKAQLRMAEITTIIEKKVVDDVLEAIVLDEQKPSSETRFVKLRDVIFKRYKETLRIKRKEKLTFTHLAISTPVSVISEVNTAEASCSVIISSPSSTKCDMDVNDVTVKEYAKPAPYGASFSSNDSNQKIYHSLLDNDSLLEEEHHGLKSESEMEQLPQDKASESGGESKDQPCVKEIVASASPPGPSKQMRNTRKRMSNTGSNRMSEEGTEDVQVIQEDGSPSSLVVVTTAGRVKNEEGDDAQGLGNNPEMVVVAPVFPVDTLLEELGLKIFGMMSDKDVGSCFQAIPKWQPWLVDQRTQILFPWVVPFFLKYLPKSSLLECRKVCRSWRDGLDNAYQTHPEHLRLDKENRIANDNLPKLVNTFQYATEIKNFLQAMESHRGNPFPGRSLILNLKTLREITLGQDWEVEYENQRRTEYWNSVIQLLDVFGSEIYFLSIGIKFFETDDTIDTNVAEILRRCLERMPNVKNLKFRILVENTTDQLIQQTRMMQLPQLLHLETVVISICGLPRAMMDSILESCCIPHKIKRVDLHSDEGGFVNAVCNFQNLEVLDTEIGIVDLAVIRNLEKRPPLRKIWLHLNDRHNDFQLLFTLLEGFADTLKDVTVFTPILWDGLVMNNESTGFRINLPKLERLDLEMNNGCLDPLIQLTSLKHLELYFHKLGPWEGSVAQLYGFEERMESSNIWTLIPSLKTLAIKGENDSGSFDKNHRRLLQRIICENEEEEEMSQNENGSSQGHGLSLKVDS